MTHLPAQTMILLAGLAASLLCAVVGAIRSLSLGRRLRLAVAQGAASREAEASSTRTLQLLAQELQAVTLSLRGHADHLQADRHPNAARMAATAAQLGGLADELGHYLLPEVQPVVLTCEECALARLVEDAVRATQIAISPGCRHFRLRQPIDPHLRIWADPRGLRLVLARVLSEAVRTSSHDDWIDIACSIEADQLCLRIEDEGAGGTASSDLDLVQDSRGIGLRLSLARSLVAGHGGSLEVEALARVGSRVTIRLPSERLRRTGPVPGGS